MAHIVMAHVVMAYLVMARIQVLTGGSSIDEPEELERNCPYSYGLYSYGPYSYGLSSYGVCTGADWRLFDRRAVGSRRGARVQR